MIDLNEIVSFFVGTGISAVFFIAFAKLSLQKVIEATIDSSFEKKNAKYADKLTRASYANSLLLEKEFDYLNKLDDYLAELVVLMFDIKSFICSEASEAQELKTPRTMGPDEFSRYFELIRELKNTTIRYDVYAHDATVYCCNELIVHMQNNAAVLASAYKSTVLSDGAHNDILHFDQVSQICEEEVALIAQTRTQVRNYLQGISSES